jgi:hypothetical protein
LGDFGIWVWCEDPDAGNNYAGACVGSLYFYDLALTKAVFGTLTVLEEDAFFSMDLTSRDHPVSVACTVSGGLADLKPGPRNTVHVACSLPGDREGDLINTVVVVTHGA